MLVSSCLVNVSYTKRNCSEAAISFDLNSHYRAQCKFREHKIKRTYNIWVNFEVAPIIFLNIYNYKCLKNINLKEPSKVGS